MLEHGFCPYSGKIDLSESLGRKQEPLLAWWYGGLLKNRQAASQPLVAMFFQRLDPQRQKLRGFFRRNIPLTTLGQVRLGSIWSEGVSHSRVDLPTETFTVSFDPNHWRYVSFEARPDGRHAPPYRSKLHTPPFRYDKNQLLAFETRTGGTLLLPCLEFLMRCYGTSAEIPRVLTTYPWSGEIDDAKSRLLEPVPDEPETEGIWRVRTKLAQGDAVFLAHVKHDPYAEQAAKSLYAQLEAVAEPGKPVFIRVRPWHRGQVRLRVAGVPLDKDGSFLGLNILGVSDPLGPDINFLMPEPEQAENGGRGHRGAGANGSDEPRITHDEEPDWGAVSRRIDAHPIERLDPPTGKAREVSRLTIGKSTAMQHVSRSRDKRHDRFASGDPLGREKGVGSLESRARVLPEGILMSVWESLGHVSEKRRLGRPEWLGVSGEWNASRWPKLIPLNPPAKSSKRHWVFLEKGITRGALVARLPTHGRMVHFVEVERRPESKESFTGLAFTSNDDPSDWIATILDRIRYTKGVFRGLADKCPGTAATYRHRTSETTGPAMTQAVENALRKLGEL